MPIPDYQSLMHPVLRVLADRKEHTLAEIRARIAAELNLSPEELAERVPSGQQPVFMNRVSWAIQYLKGAGAIDSQRRAAYSITDRGVALLQANPIGVSLDTLRQFPEFTDFAGRGGQEDAVPEVTGSPAESKDTPEEALGRNYKLQRDALALELLEAIKNGTPAAFEKLVVDLLVAMGYGGSDEDAGQVVGRSGDGGIDGVIKQDRLGLDAIYVQAKRWKENVGSPEIMKFSGGLTKRHAGRGVFITSSGFTRDAEIYVESLPQKIILIGGKHLASLMIEYNVGVAADKTYTLKRLDPAYFENF